MIKTLSNRLFIDKVNPAFGTIEKVLKEFLEQTLHELIMELINKGRT